MVPAEPAASGIVARGSDGRPNWRAGGGGHGRWKNTAHDHGAEDADDAKPEDDDTRESDDELVPEEIAYNHHTAYVAYQAATQGRGADPQEVRKRADVCASAGARTPAAPAPAKTVHVVLMTPGGFEGTTRGDRKARAPQR